MGGASPWSRCNSSGIGSSALSLVKADGAQAASSPQVQSRGWTYGTAVLFIFHLPGPGWAFWWNQYKFRLLLDTDMYATSALMPDIHWAEAGEAQLVAPVD